MANNKPTPSNVGAERAVLAGIIRHGGELLLDLSEMLTANDFSHPTLAKIFTVLRHMGIDHEYGVFETPVIIVMLVRMGVVSTTNPRQSTPKHAFTMTFHATITPEIGRAHV
jgi:hypothetical protein